MYRFVMNNFKNPDDTMNEIIRLNGLNTKQKIIKYIAQEFNKYNTNRYPLNGLVVLDDFANNPLLTNKKSPLHAYFTKKGITILHLLLMFKQLNSFQKTTKE